MKALNSAASRLLGTATPKLGEACADALTNVIQQRGADRHAVLNGSLREMLRQRLYAAPRLRSRSQIVLSERDLNWEAFVFRHGMLDSRYLFVGRLASKAPQPLESANIEELISSFNTESSVTRSRLRKVVERLLHAAEQDRRRMAGEMHDDLGQVLTLLKTEIARLGEAIQLTESNAPEEFHSGVARIGDLAEDALHGMRRAVVGLCPPVLEKLGLSAAVEWLAGTYRKATAIRFLTRIEPADPISHSASVTAYRILQEVLTNILRHSEATCVEIRLMRTTGKLVLSVKDDGKGIPGDFSHHETLGFGIVGMRARAWALDGDLEVKSRSPRGTTVRLTLPLG